MQGNSFYEILKVVDISRTDFPKILESALLFRVAECEGVFAERCGA